MALTGHQGVITGTFGKSGKLKVRLDGEGLAGTEKEVLQEIVNSEIQLRYKKNMMKHKANKFK